MISIHQGKEEDLPEVLELVKELAIYEHALEEVENTVEKMKEDGFGKEPVFGFLLAKENGVAIGLSLYYFRYSTWKGKRLFLEDLIVKEAHRSKGVGKLLLDETISKAKSLNCTGMMWQVLDWNEPAINFYKKYGARLDNEWINCHLDF